MNAFQADDRIQAEYAEADYEAEARQPAYVAIKGAVYWRHPDGRGLIPQPLGLARQMRDMRLADERPWVRAMATDLAAAIREAEAYHMETA